jgi:hypothetical protein
MTNTLRALDAIEAERRRQITHHNFTPSKDMINSKGEMGKAAACYAFTASLSAKGREQFVQNAVPPKMWPAAWRPEWFRLSTKPHGNAARIRELEKAGALIIAELERLYTQESLA